MARGYLKYHPAFQEGYNAFWDWKTGYMPQNPYHGKTLANSAWKLGWQNAYVDHLFMTC